MVTKINAPNKNPGDDVGGQRSDSGLTKEGFNFQGPLAPEPETLNPKL